ncbi:MAG: decaprenyl-phosphate phosphoribosyltransferase [Acidimicrobiales bacterium]
MIAPADERTTSTRAAVVRLLRPRQWVKGVLVLAAPAAAGVLHEPGVLAETALAFVAFSLAASGTYCLNDASDVESDRAHPTKRFRPVAEGSVSVAAARLLGIGLLVGSVAVAAVAGGWRLPLVILGYVALTTSYTVWLKHIAVVDLAAVAAGFVLRAIAGAVATDVEVSDWFLIVASFGSLFMVAGKRSAELGEEGEVSSHRRVLSMYSAAYLTYVRSVASGVTLLAYTLFAFEKADLSAAAIPWFELSIVPFGLAILRYAQRLDQGAGGAPEDVVLRDRALQVLGLCWAVLAAIGVYTT